MNLARRYTFWKKKKMGGYTTRVRYKTVLFVQVSESNQNQLAIYQSMHDRRLWHVEKKLPVQTNHHYKILNLFCYQNQSLLYTNKYSQQTANHA